MIATSGRFAIAAGGTVRLRGVLEADRRELLALLPELRRVCPEDVHRARVLARRLRALLRAYAPAFDRIRARHARRLLKRLAQTLDDCREAHVREALLRDLAGGVVGASPQMPVALNAPIERTRTDAIRAARRQLSRPGPARELREALSGLVVEKGLGLDWLLVRLDRRSRRLRRRARCSRDDDGLHRLRLAVKSLRYSLAPLEDIEPASGRRLHARLREAQERLGEQHDAALALAWLERTGAAHTVVGRPLRRALRERERAARRAAQRAVRKIDPAWKRWRAGSRDVTEALSVHRDPG